MQRAYFSDNRKRLYQRMDAGSLLSLREALWNTDSVYLTELKCKFAVLRGEA